MEPRAFFLKASDGGAHTAERDEGHDPLAPRPRLPKKKKKKGIIITKPKIGHKPHACSSSCSSSSTSSAANSAASSSSSLRRRRRTTTTTTTRGRGDVGGDGVQDLALPLGMSFAAVVSQVSLLLLRDLIWGFWFLLIVKVAIFLMRTASLQRNKFFYLKNLVYLDKNCGRFGPLGSFDSESWHRWHENDYMSNCGVQEMSFPAYDIGLANVYSNLVVYAYFLS